VQCVYSGVG